LIHNRKKGVLIFLFLFLTPGLLANINSVGRWGIYRLQKQRHPSENNIDFFNACKYIRQNTASNAIIQGPLGKFSYLNTFTNRRVVLLDIEHGQLFNVSPAIFNKISNFIELLFNNLNIKRAYLIAKELKIDYLLVKDHYFKEPLSKGFHMLYANKHYWVLAVEK